MDDNKVTWTCKQCHEETRQKFWEVYYDEELCWMTQCPECNTEHKIKLGELI